MREIEFRGMSLDGNWHCGLLTELKTSAYGAEQGFFISNEKGLPFAYAIRPETISQYIGIEDKNGTKMYEGDILEIEFLGYKDMYKTKGVIEWVAEKTRFDIRIISIPLRPLDEIKSKTIIGNIYENPELLRANG